MDFLFWLLWSKHLPKWAKILIVITIVLGLGMFAAFKTGVVRISAEENQKPQEGQLSHTRRFRFADERFNPLSEKLIEAGFYYSPDDDSAKPITFRANTGTIQISGSNKCLFYGGCLVACFGEKECVIEDIQLDAWSDPPGNPCDLLEEKIGEQIAYKVTAEGRLVAKRLAECFIDLI